MLTGIIINDILQMTGIAEGSFKNWYPLKHTFKTCCEKSVWQIDNPTEAREGIISF